MLILLDIDGVMVPEKSWKRPEFLNDGFPVFSTTSIHALQKIIFKTGATILLTTSHKSTYSIPEWFNIFNLRGIHVIKIERLTTNELNLNRRDEILNWYTSKYHLGEKFVIIDDDKSLNNLHGHLRENLVLTSPLVGLTNELADRAISILNPET
ncbi:HAD domain-containing protein [Pedobacter sp. AW31-3R]|uniref:HAD domain-containing protein n=1 Tax=Pedobacter sp. AW31-3R TaxID=3445781 RepID=UPI003F9F3A74